MKTVLVAVAVLVLLFTGFVAISVVDDWAWGLKRKHVASEIVASYRRAASNGQLPQPASSVGSIHCFSMCYYSLPSAVHVKTASGEEFSYTANRGTNSPSWRFTLIYGKDAQGITITNKPGI